MSNMNKLIDNIYKMIKEWGKDNYWGDPEIVLLCSPEYYCNVLRKHQDIDKSYYIKSDYDYGIEFFSIIGLKVPVIISHDLEKNTEYKLMFRDDYELLEKEKIYNKIIAMFDKRW